jgi:hypothetical protein
MNEFTITFTERDLDLLGRLLPDHPYKLVAPLLDKINSQIQEQLQKEVNDANSVGTGT